MIFIINGYKAGHVPAIFVSSFSELRKKTNCKTVEVDERSQLCMVFVRFAEELKQYRYD